MVPANVEKNDFQSGRQFTEDEAKALYKAEVWKDMSLRERAESQMVQRRLFMPFDKFHEAVEKTLGRPVWTHEFGLNVQGLKNELFNGGKAPTFEEIMNLIPEEKRIFVRI